MFPKYASVKSKIVKTRSFIYDETLAWFSVNYLTAINSANYQHFLAKIVLFSKPTSQISGNMKFSHVSFRCRVYTAWPVRSFHVILSSLICVSKNLIMNSRIDFWNKKFQDGPNILAKSIPILEACLCISNVSLYYLRKQRKIFVFALKFWTLFFSKSIHGKIHITI